MKKVFLLFFLGLAFLYADFRAVNETKLKEAIQKGVVVIDIRRADEWKRFGMIEGSRQLTFFDKYGKYDASSWIDEFSKLVKNKKQPFVLVCAHANRTKVVGEMLNTQLGYENIYELEGGIMYGWIDKGQKVIH